ncbi:MAG: hypothetical protein C0467_20135 [Planctomycetaceae bacterium]|nr:hypothetical protein [Planctomycetaceae bacterium]
MVEFEGEFETHITIRVAEPGDINTLQAWAERRQLTFHHIILERGQTPSQPMIGRRGRGRLSGELIAAADLNRRLHAEGFCVSRVKIEAAPGNGDVPNTDAEALDRHSGRYFEHHVKLVLDPETDVPGLANVAIAHSAHLSRNARRVRTDGRQERFVTQRCHAVGRQTASKRLDALLATLLTGGHYVLSVEKEFVVYDSDPSVDTGWLENGGQS